jgi:KGK domain
VDKKFEPLAVGEVLSIEESVQILIGHRTFRVGELAEAIRRQLENGVSGWTQDKNAWFSEDGVPCEVLQFNAGGWQKGKVKINLVFCPDESGDEGKPASASSDKESETLAPDSKDELNLEVSSTSMDDELDLDDSSTSMDDELDLEDSSTSMDDELDLEDSSTSMDDELDLDDSSTSMDDDEFELGFSEVAHEEQKQEAPTEIYSEMEREAAIISADGIDFDDASDDLDDEFDEISQSIEDELEEEEDLTDGEDELLDLGEISTDSDDDLDFGEISDSDDDEFELTDLSSNDDLDNNGSESLLDDVWQDMNKATW